MDHRYKVGGYVKLAKLWSAPRMQQWPIIVPIMLKSLRMMRIKGWLVSILTSQGIRKFINARKWCICSKIAKRVPSI